MLVTHTAQCALDNTAVLTFAFQGLSNRYLGFFFLMKEWKTKGTEFAFVVVILESIISRIGEEGPQFLWVLWDKKYF